jgi:Protein of unknown function (DUF3551)
MRQVPFAMFFVVGLVAVATSSSSGHVRHHHVARAQAVVAPSGIQDRFCLQGRRWGYPGNCEFSTYEQCMATASGTPDYCGENPQYLFAEQPRGYYWPPR